jgi:hypothetical protein
MRGLGVRRATGGRWWGSDRDVGRPTAAAGSGLWWRRCAAAAAFVVIGPPAGLFALAVGLALAGGSWDGRGGSPAGYLAVVIPLSCAIAAFGIARRLAAGRRSATGLAVVTFVWSSVSWVLAIVVLGLSTGIS